MSFGRWAAARCTETAGSRGACDRPQRQIGLLFGWSSMPDHWRSRVPAGNREYLTPRVGRSHFGGGASGSRSAVPTYPHPPHKWTTSPDSGSTAGSLRASLIASPHWGHSGAVSGSFRTSIDLGEHEGHCIASAESIFASPLTVQYCSPTRRKARAFPLGSPIRRTGRLASGGIA